MFGTIILASFVGSVFALIGGVFLLLNEKKAKKWSLTLVSFAVGSLLGAAFLELLPEAMEHDGAGNIFIPVIAGILLLFIFEKTLKWYHCHDRETCDIHTFSSAVLAGDAVHNFIDGIIIALAFSVNTAAGVAATIAIFFHEVPQEIADFGVLLHAGYTRRKVFFYNLATALTTPLGAIVGYLLLPTLTPALPYLLAFAGGMFIYIAISDLMPELRHKGHGIDFPHILAILLGLTTVWAVTILFG